MSKKSSRVYLLFIFLILCYSCTTTKSTILFNEDWSFYKGDASNAQEAGFNDKAWRKLDLPHDWSIEGPFDQKWASATGFLPGGIGWYRKTFTLGKSMRSKNIYLHFDGVYMNSEVWINGHYLGKRPNGFIPFRYDITKHLNEIGNNVIAVKADHTEFADSRWYTGSGIYRNVYLIATNPVHVNLWGIAFTTPQVSSQNAMANVVVTIANDLPSDADVVVKAQLVDKNKNTVAAAQTEVKTGGGQQIDASLSMQVQSPALWSVDQPNLYNLKVALSVKGKAVDEVTEEVGFRNFRFDANNGFFLNGENLKLKGVCIHDDAGALGVAVPEEVWERRLLKLKEAGCNSIRLSHNPHADYLYKLCDRLGFLVQDEAFDEWEVGKNKWIEGWNVGKPGNDGYNKYFKDWADADVRDMILRNRNRPSIIMWSIGNEIDYPNDPYTHEVLNTGRNPQIYGRGYLPDHPRAGRLGEIAKHLVEVVERYDTTRPVTAALAGVVMSNTTIYPEVLDIVGYNYQEYRYPEDHKQYPDRIIYGSENGRGLSAWNAVDSNAYISAQYLWTGIDYLGEAGRWPLRSNGAGLLDLAGLPKPDFYFRKSLWTKEPMIYIGATQLPREDARGTWNQTRSEQNWNWKAGDTVRVNCFTNCDEAELFLNGKSLGRKKMTDGKGRIISWDVLYQPGVLDVKGYRQGQELASAKIQTASEAAAIAAVSDQELLDAENKGLAHIEIQLTDKDGNPVFNAANEITVLVEGPAKLLGLESGDHASHESYQSNTRKAFKGRLLAYIQSTKKRGPVKLTIQSPGLATKVVRLKAR